MAKGPEQIILTMEERLALKQRIQNPTELSPDDVKILLSLLHFHTWMIECLACAKLSIKRLKKLLGFKGERNPSHPHNNSGNNKKKPDHSSQDLKKGRDLSTDLTSNKPDATRDTSPNTDDKNVNTTGTTKIRQIDPNQNHGRYGAQDYPGCPVVNVPFDDEDLQQGFCPACRACHTTAKLLPKAPRVVVILKGQSLIAGRRYVLQRARCSVCEKYFTAPPPEAVVNQVIASPSDKLPRHNKHYDVSCVTSLVIYHYYGGLPFKRLETLQAAQAVPMPDATQFDLIKQGYEDTFKPVIDQLRLCAARGQLFYFDDTPQRILEQIQLNQVSTQTQAVHATTLISQYNDHSIVLFETNTSVAGKSFQSLLSERSGDEDFISMSDASSQNFPNPKNKTGVNETLMAHWIISLCLVHGRRPFLDCIKGLHDADARFVLDVISEVYEHERHCKMAKLEDKARLQYHQEHSGPKMEGLRIWLNNLYLQKKVEPNSPMGQAIRYLLRHWFWLTQFLRVPGVPLDNNFAERVLRILIRYRKASLFYRTFYGAELGDGLMSLLHTAGLGNINLFDYLNELQRQGEAVREHPMDWLPWTYQQTLERLIPLSINGSPG